jgi:hypothetical protein
MKKLQFILFGIAILFPLSLSAEITREQADAIVLEYIQNEVTWDYILSRNDNPPGEDGRTSVTWYNNFLHIENLSVEYPCWTYFISNPRINGPYIILFLFINRENGSMLEVKHKQAFGINIENWTEIATSTSEIKEVNKNRSIAVSPNPVSDWLNIASDTGISRIEIYDSSGKMLLAESVQNDANYSLNLSSLPGGWYLLNIFDPAGEKVKEHKLIKN